MKRRMLSLVTALVLCLGLLPGTALGAETGEDPSVQPRATPADINMDHGGFVFAQGVPIVIKENNGITSIYDTGGTLLSGTTDVSSCAIYGGWYDLGTTHTGGTSIVMESGTVPAIFGGSYGDILDGNTNIVLNGGTAGWVYGGGNQSTVTGTAYVTVNSGARIWGAKRTDPNAEYLGTVFGGGFGGTVSNTEVTFHGGDAGWIYGGGEGGCACTNTHVKFMGQPDDFMAVSGGGNGGSVEKAVVDFHGNGSSLNNKGISVFGGGYGDFVGEVQIIIGENSTPSSTVFYAQWPDSSSTVGSAIFEVHVSAARLSMMNSSGLNGSGVTGTVTAEIYGDANTDGIFGTALTEIDQLIIESGSFELFSPMALDRLEVKESGVAVIPAVGGTTALDTLSGSGTVLFAKRRETQTTLPVTVNHIDIPDGARIKVGSIGGYLSQNWADTVVFQGPGVANLSSAAGFSSKDAGYYLAKTEDGSGIQVKEGTEQKQTVIDPVPTFDKPSYQYGETMRITMGLKAEGQPVPGQLLEVRGGVSGMQTFAAAETGADGQVSFDLPVDDNLWASREHGLQAMFHATEDYKESSYGISLRDAGSTLGYIVTGAQVTLEGEIAAPVRGEAPVKALTVSGSGICTAEVVWTPEDAAFRPETAYTASIRLVPKQGYRLDGGRLDNVLYQGQVLTGGTEADGSILIPDVASFSPLPAIHVAGIALDQTALSLQVGGTARLTAEITPADADNQAVSWSSSDAAVAAVDQTGMVTAVSPGTATVTVTTSDGGKTAVCTVTVEKKDVVILPDPPEGDGGTKFQLVMETGISQVPEGLREIEALNTPEKLTAMMKTAVTQASGGVSQENIAVYDVVLMVSRDGGATWIPATSENFPPEGLTVTLPYPEGTTGEFRFTVVHMFTAGVFGHTPGDTETPSVTNTADGLRFTVTGLSPISVGWVQPATGPSGGGGSGSGSGTGSYTVTAEQPAHGKVTADRASAASGSTVTLTVTPDEGYELDSLTVTDSRGEEIKLTAQGNGRYTFTMPGRAVTIQAAFAPLPDHGEEPCGGGADCPSRGFADLDIPGAWYHEAVDYVLRANLMDGYGNGLFGPNDHLTRAQLAQILYSREGKPAVTGSSTFPDAAKGAWYSDAITWAAENGIVSGYNSGLFGPHDSVTREQLAVMLWRYAGSPAAGGQELRFPDADKASGYALEALRWAVENGILSGSGSGQLAPRGLATRAQAAQMLKNAMEVQAGTP